MDDQLPDAPWATQEMQTADLPDAPWAQSAAPVKAASVMHPDEAPTPTRFNERQRAFRQAIRSGSPEQPAELAVPGPDLSGARPKEGELQRDWTNVGKGLVKGLPATLSGGLVGDIESTGRLLGKQLGVKQETTIPTTTEGGYLGPRGLDLMAPAATAEEAAGMGIASLAAPGAIGKLGRLTGLRKPPVGLVGPETPTRTVDMMSAKPPTVPEALPTAPASEPIGVPRDNGARLLSPNISHVPDVSSPEHALEALASRRAAGAAGTSPLEGVSPEAIQRIHASFEGEGLTPHTLAQRLEEMSPHQFLSEIGDSPTFYARGITSSPGLGRTELMNAFRGRASEAPQRIGTVFDQIFGRDSNTYSIAKQISRDQKKASDPAYRAFRETQITPTPELVELIPRLKSAGAFSKAKELAGISGVPWQQEQFMAGVPGKYPTARTWDLVKRSLDSKISKAFRDGDNTTGSALKALRGELITAIDAHPDPLVQNVWKNARNVYAGPAKLKAALEYGRDLLTRGVDTDEFVARAAAKDFGPAEIDAMKTGVRAYLKDKLGRPGRQNLSTLNDVLAENNLQKLRALLGDEEAAKLERAIRHEYEMHFSPQNLGNSLTAEKTIAQDIWAAKPSGLEKVITTGVGLIKHPGKTLTGSALEAQTARTMNKRQLAADQIRRDAARIYSLQGAERDAVAQWILEHGADYTPPAPKRASGGRVAVNTRAPVIRKYDVPYLAGASDNGQTVYLDRRVPPRIKLGKAFIDPAVPLRIHEMTEWALMTKHKLSYEEAHKRATAAERNWVESHGHSWALYEETMDGLLSHIEHEHPKKPPPDLYLKPYPHDKQKLLEKNRAAGGAVWEEGQNLDVGGVADQGFDPQAWWKGQSPEALNSQVPNDYSRSDRERTNAAQDLSWATQPSELEQSPNEAAANRIRRSVRHTTELPAERAMPLGYLYDHYAKGIDEVADFNRKKLLEKGEDPNALNIARQAAQTLGANLTGVAAEPGMPGVERQPTWPERMVVSGATLPSDVITGKYNVKPTEPGMWSDEDENRRLAGDAEIFERVQDMAGMAGVPAVGMKPNEATLTSGLNRRPEGTPTQAYHGTSKPGFERFETPDAGQYMPDRGLGIHLAKDPEIANTFAKDSGGVYPVDMPPEEKFYPIKQDHLPYIEDKTSPKYARNVISDQSAMEHEIYRVAYQQDPEMFARHLERRWNMPREEAVKAAQDITSGKPYSNELMSPRSTREPIVGLDDYIERDGVVKPWNEGDRAKAIAVFQKHLQDQGYVGVKYINTSPMETANAKDPTSYVLFNPREHARSRFTGALMSDSGEVGAPLSALAKSQAERPTAVAEKPFAMQATVAPNNLPAPYKPAELGGDIQNFLRLSQGYEKKYGQDWVTKLEPTELATLKAEPALQKALANIEAAKGAGVLDKMLEQPLTRRDAFRTVGAIGSAVANAGRLGTALKMLEVPKVDLVGPAYQKIGGLKDQFKALQDEVMSSYNRTEWKLREARDAEIKTVRDKYGALYEQLPRGRDYDHYAETRKLNHQLQAEIAKVEEKHAPAIGKIQQEMMEKNRQLKTDFEKDITGARENLNLPKLNEQQQKVLDYVVKPGRRSFTDFVDGTLQQNPYELSKAADILKDLAKHPEMEKYHKDDVGYLVAKMSDAEKAQIAEHIKPVLLQDPHISMGDVRTIVKAFPSLKGFQAFSNTGKIAGPLSALANQHFYSAVEKAIAGAPQQKMHASQWMGWLKNQPGIKAEELNWLGLGDKADIGEGLVTKQQMLDRVRDKGVQVGEVEKKGGPRSHADANEAAYAEVKDDFYSQYPKENNNAFQNWMESPEGQAAFDRALAETTNSPRYSDYQLPGGENYREMLLTLPEKPRKTLSTAEADELRALLNKDDRGLAGTGPKLSRAEEDRLTALQTKVKELRSQIGQAEPFRHNHWDEPNVLGHLRMNDREIPGVGKALHGEELQSDMHQLGRKNGYQQDIPQRTFEARRDPKGDGWTVFDSDGNQASGAALGKADAEEIARQFTSQQRKKTDGVPDAPFKTSWPDLLLKRLIAKAAKEDYAAVSWTPGEQQAARYDLSKQVEKIQAIKNADGTYQLAAEKKGGQGKVALGASIPEAKLADHVGKDLAEKIVRDANPFLDEAEKPEGWQPGMSLFADSSKVGAPLSALIGEKYATGTHTVSEPLSLKVYRTGAQRDIGRGIFFGDSPESVKPYSSLHNNAPINEYTVSPKKTLITESPFALHKELFNGKSFQDAVWAEDKKSGFKSSIEASRKVEAKMAAALKRKGYDAFVYTKPPAPAKHEISILNPKAISKVEETPNRAHGGRVNADNINHNPSEAQKSSGAYAKDHINIHGLNITIENAKGSTRSGVGADGSRWETKLPSAYGYFKRSEGADGDHVDVYVGPHLKSNFVWIVDQVDPDTKRFDETKTLLGFGSKAQALKTYIAAFSDGKGKDRIGAVHALTVPALKQWLEHGDTKSPYKPPVIKKLSHASVDYTPKALNPKNRCGVCVKFIPASLGGPDCVFVAKPINPQGWCSRFRRV